MMDFVYVKAFYGFGAQRVLMYMGPKILSYFGTHGVASDVWSLGCVIAFFMFLTHMALSFTTRL